MHHICRLALVLPLTTHGDSRQRWHDESRVGTGRMQPSGLQVVLYLMDIDIVSVFPEYFDVLRLSLLGKAQENGLMHVAAHNLRDWTHDVHHSVDDTPVGGGAGMVMKPEVWGECLDELLGLRGDAYDGDANPGESAGTDPIGRHEPDSAGSVALTNGGSAPHPTDTVNDIGTSDRPVMPGEAATLDGAVISEDAIAPGNSADAHGTDAHGTVLIFPNPSAPLFTQRDATELSHAHRLIFGCGRYEGYDARIPEYYRAQGVDVREYSIGDYVLNGGEVAVSVMLEAITRLLPGFMGNPESIVEESYTGGNALLEHRQYTKPAAWRSLEVPDVLLSGDHGKVDRFRRDEALQRTSEIRPDLIETLDCKQLDKPDRKTLMALGWEVSGAHPRHVA